MASVNRTKEKLGSQGKHGRGQTRHTRRDAKVDRQRASQAKTADRIARRQAPRQLVAVEPLPA